MPRMTCLLVATTALLAACADPSGVGFDRYEVPQKQGAAQATPIQWAAAPPLPRYRVTLAATPDAARQVQPVGQAPKAGVSALADAGIGLRVVEDGARVWLVAEKPGQTVAATPALRREAEARSGCLAETAHQSGPALVFRLNCR